MHQRYEAGALGDYNVRLTQKFVQAQLDDGSTTDWTILDHDVHVSLVGKVTMVHSLWFKNEQFETLKSFFLDL